MIMKKGGLYSKLNISVKAADALILTLTLVLILTSFFIIKHAGFVVKFDSSGGSLVPQREALYADILSEPETPQREAFTFTGWYRDSECTDRWDFENDTVTESMTLYAGWKKKST